MVKITIDGKEYGMRFTLGFWEEIKKVADVTQANIQEKLNEDFGTIGSLIVQYGIYHAIPRDKRVPLDEMKPSLEDIKDALDQSVIDAIEAAYIEGLSKAQKKFVDKAMELQEKQIEDLGKKKE